MAFFSSNSCGQCPSCRMETHMLNSIMTQVLAKKANEKLLRQVPVIIKNATIKPALCGLVQMPARPMLSALEKFPEEFRRYVDVIPQPAVQ
jgi:NADH-quinone oxidoreductase subunit F